MLNLLIVGPYPRLLDVIYLWPSIGIISLTSIDLIPLLTDYKVSFEAEARAKEMKKLHLVHNRKVNKSYKARANKNMKRMEFKLGDLLCSAQKRRFPNQEKNKLMSRWDRPFRVLPNIGASTYKLELLRDVNLSTIFNMGDISPYVEDDINMRIWGKILFKEGGWYIRGINPSRPKGNKPSIPSWSSWGLLLWSQRVSIWCLHGRGPALLDSLGSQPPSQSIIFRLSD